MPIRAGVVRVALMPALITALQMTAESGRATGFDSAQHALMSVGQRDSVRLAKLLAMDAHDIGDFEGLPHCVKQRRLGLGGRGRKPEKVQRTGRSANCAGRHSQVARRCREAAVTQQELNLSQIGSAFQ